MGFYYNVSPKKMSKKGHNTKLTESLLNML